MLTVRRKCALKAREKRTTKPEPEEPPKGLQLKDRDTKRDNRAIVTRHRQRIGQGGENLQQEVFLRGGYDEESLKLTQDCDKKRLRAITIQQ